MELTLQVCLNASIICNKTYLEVGHLLSSYMNVLREHISVILMLIVVITVP